MARSWSGLSPAYQRRLARAGITPKAYESGVSVTAARGHAKTPERPSRAARNPERYRDYVDTRQTLIAQVMAKKERLFGERMRYRRKRGKMVYEKAFVRSQSEKNVREGKQSVAQMRRFLAMDEYEADEVIAEDESEWEWLFYH